MKDQSIHVNMRLVSTPLAVAALLLAVFGLARAGVLAPPQVIDLEPDPEVYTAPVDASVSVTYDQDMDPATVNPQSFAVHARQTGWLTETLSVSGGTITLDPLNVLHAGELVQASATTATLSLGGEAPLAPTVWQFTTAAWGGNAQFHEHQLLRESLSRFVAIGDLDGDGDLDAITSRANGNTRIYHNDGSGTLSEVQNFDHTAYHITDVELGDLDGDGDLDAVLICYTGSGNKVLFNNGDGTFTDSGESIWSEYDLFAKLGDLDGDGDLDLFVVGTESVGTIRVWKNDGTGHFTLASDFDSAYEHYGVVLGDLDGDGDLDAFTTGWNNTYNKVWLNDGTGAFSEAQSIPNANTTIAQLGDLDGDGDLDAYLTNTQVHYTGNLPDEVWMNDGAGHFTDSGQRLDTLDSVYPALGDLDADGDLDVYLPGEVYHRQPDEVWANDGTGTFTLFRSVDEYYASGGASLGDLDNDGNLDVIAFGNNINDDGFQVYLNGDWTQAAPIPHGSANSATVQCPDDPDRFYVIGGWSGPDEPITQTLRFDADTGDWFRLAQLPSEISSAAAVCYQDKIYVAGGEWFDISNDFYIYDIPADSWSNGLSLPRQVKGAAMGAWDGRLYLVGGTPESNDQGLHPVNQVDVYDIAAQTWDADALPPMPAAASFPGYTQAGPYLYVVGGYSGDYDANVTVTQRLDMAIGQWQAGPEFTSARAMLAAAISGQHFYAIGGDLNAGDELDATDLVERLDLADWPDGSWQDLGDPLPAISQGNTSACTNALLGGEVWSTGGGYIDDDGNPHIYYSNLFHPAEACLGYNYAATLAPTALGYFGYPGEVVTYTLTVTNSGDTPDAYDVLVTSTWPASAPVIIGALDPGESVELLVTVEVPSDAAPGEQDVATITITSQGNPDVSASADLTTTALEVYAHLEVGHLAPFAADPGTAVTVTLDGTTVLTGFEFAESTGYISVTANVTHTVEIFAMGVPTPAIGADIHLMPDTDYTAMAIGGANDWPLELLALEDDNRAPAAGSFKLRLGHLAPFSDTITGTLADIRLQDGTPVITDVPFGAVADYIELAAGEYDLKVTTPGGGTTLIDPLPATFNAGDIVSAFAVGDGANQPLGVFAWPAGVPGSLLPLVRYDVELTPASLAGSAYPGEMVEYTLTLSNTGNFTDTFDLTYAGSEWEVTLPVTQTTLAAGASIEVSVQVMIPADAAKGSTDSATITAVSQGDPTASAIAELTTTAVWRQVYMPLIVNHKSSQ